MNGPCGSQDCFARVRDANTHMLALGFGVHPAKHGRTAFIGKPPSTAWRGVSAHLNIGAGLSSNTSHDGDHATHCIATFQTVDTVFELTNICLSHALPVSRQ